MKLESAGRPKPTRKWPKVLQFGRHRPGISATWLFNSGAIPHQPAFWWARTGRAEITGRWEVRGGFPRGTRLMTNVPSRELDEALAFRLCFWRNKTSLTEFHCAALASCQIKHDAQRPPTSRRRPAAYMASPCCLNGRPDGEMGDMLAASAEAQLHVVFVTPRLGWTQEGLARIGTNGSTEELVGGRQVMIGGRYQESTPKPRSKQEKRTPVQISLASSVRRMVDVTRAPLELAEPCGEQLLREPKRASWRRAPPGRGAVARARRPAAAGCSKLRAASIVL